MQRMKVTQKPLRSTCLKFLHCFGLLASAPHGHSSLVVALYPARLVFALLLERRESCVVRNLHRHPALNTCAALRQPSDGINRKQHFHKAPVC